MPGETSKAFTAFVEYLRLGPQRSVEQTCRNLGKSSGTLQIWQERFAWVKRAADYDAHLIAVEHATVEAATKGKAIERLEARERHKGLEQRIAEKALKALEAWFDKGEFRINSPRDAAYLLEIASKVGRLSLGLATEHQEVTGEGGGPVQVDLGPSLKRVYGAVEAPQGAVEVGGNEKLLGVGEVFDAEVVSGQRTEEQNAL